MPTIYGSVSSNGTARTNPDAYSSTRLSKGKYQVTFADSFNDEPSVALTIIEEGTSGKTVCINSVDSNQFSCAIQTNSGNTADQGFDFIVVGS